MRVKHYGHSAAAVSLPSVDWLLVERIRNKLQLGNMSMVFANALHAYAVHKRISHPRYTLTVKRKRRNK